MRKMENGKTGLAERAGAGNEDHGSRVYMPRCSSIFKGGGGGVSLVGGVLDVLGLARAKTHLR